ncbi:MAG: ATP-binding protein [Deltaproteobacteria bacterium]|nr:ATP-binding protein [Deltaproteobacteria bacterium]
MADFCFGVLIAGAEHVASALLIVFKYVLCGLRTAIVLVRFKRPENEKAACRLMEEGTTQANLYQSLTGAKPGVRFADIAGLDEAKREINLRMILPFRYPERAKRYGIRRGGGLLLYGPPGTGKTMLAKAVATELDAAFYHVRPSDILSGQVGQAEANVARLFETLRREKKAVLFVDEVEALVPSRRKNGSTIMQRVISQMLGEVDGLAPKEAGHALLLIGATNEPGMIDPAMLRPGRFDTKLLIGPPDASARAKLLETALRDKPVAPDLDLETLVTQTEGMTGAEIVELVNQAADKAFIRDIATQEDQCLDFSIVIQDATPAHFDDINCSVF